MNFYSENKTKQKTNRHDVWCVHAQIHAAHTSTLVNVHSEGLQYVGVGVNDWNYQP